MTERLEQTVRTALRTWAAGVTVPPGRGLPVARVGEVPQVAAPAGPVGGGRVGWARFGWARFGWVVAALVAVAGVAVASWVALRPNDTRTVAAPTPGVASSATRACDRIPLGPGRGEWLLRRLVVDGLEVAVDPCRPSAAVVVEGVFLGISDGSTFVAARVGADGRYRVWFRSEERGPRAETVDPVRSGLSGLWVGDGFTATMRSAAASPGEQSFRVVGHGVEADFVGSSPGNDVPCTSARARAGVRSAVWELTRLEIDGGDLPIDPCVGIVAGVGTGQFRGIDDGTNYLGYEPIEGRPGTYRFRSTTLVGGGPPAPYAVALRRLDEVAARLDGDVLTLTGDGVTATFTRHDPRP